MQPFVDASVATSSTWYHPNPTGWQEEALLLLRTPGVPQTPDPVIVTTLPGGTAGSPYHAALTTTDHPEATWALAGGALPAGLSRHGYTISGTPRAAGRYHFLVRVTDSDGRAATATVTITIAPAPAGTWTATEASLPANASGAVANLQAVACPSASVCAAAGGYIATDPPGGAMLLWKAGSTWTSAEVRPPGSWDQFQGNWGSAASTVACESSSLCVAIGSYYDSSDANQGWIASGSGTSWGATEVPVPAGVPPTAQRELEDVACASSGCVAAGWYVDSAGTYRGMLVTGSGAPWTATAVPLPANYTGDSVLYNIGCQPAGPCTATTLSSNPAGLIVTGWGTSWTTAEVPLPSGGTPGTALLNSVACPPASPCVVAGIYQDNAGLAHGLMETWSGTAWTPAATPLPSAAPPGSGEPTSAVCLSASSCSAVGYYVDHASSNAYPMLLSGSGASWTATQLPLPANAQGLNVRQDTGPFLTCVSASQCVAVGTYADSSGSTHGLLLTNRPS